VIARRIYAVVVLASGVLLGSPAWLLGFPPAGDDSVTHAVWYAYFSKQFWAGDLYPRWLADMNAGLGSPAFFYYAPLPYHFTSLLAPLFPANVSPLRPLGVAAALALAASGFAAYAWLRKFCDEPSAAAGAIIYMFAPYHLAFDLYMRDAFAEVFAFVWLPLILHFARSVSDRRRMALVGLAISYAALVLTHLPTTLIFSPVPICYAYFLTPLERGRMRSLVATLAAMTLGAGLAAIYWLPAVTTQSFVSMQELESRLYYQRFVPSVTLNAMRHEGKIFWLSLTTATLIVCAYFARRAHSQFATRALSLREDDRESIFWLACAALGVFMMTLASAPVWKIVRVLQSIQFPWRFNILLCLAASALVALSLHVNRRDAAHVRESDAAHVRRRDAAHVGRLAVGFACLMLAGWIALMSVALWQAYGDRELARRFARGVDVWVELGRDAPEYRPAWASSNSHIFLETFRQNFCPGATATTTKVCVVEGAGNVAVESWQPRAFALRVSSAGGAVLRVRQFYYPGWTALLDGNPLAVSHSDTDGLLSLSVPGGEHRVEVALRRNVPELAGQIVSALSVIALLLMAAWAMLRRSGATAAEAHD
jgi:hypothetical protein